MDAVLEQRCLDACRRGERAAYKPLVEAYFARAVRLARALVGGPDAEDIAQEAFVAAFRAMPKHEPGRPFYPWLRGILLNRARVLVRSRNRARARRESAAERPGHWAAPRAVAAPARTGDILARAMESLDDDERALLVLKHVEGYTYDELAAQLGIPRGTVMSRLYRVRLRLRERLQELDPSLLGGGAEAEVGDD